MKDFLLAVARIAVIFGCGVYVGRHLWPQGGITDWFARATGPRSTAPLIPERLYKDRLDLHRGSRARADLVMLGDSITEGGPWSEYLEGVPVLNRGISGELSDGALARLPSIIALKPRVVSLLTGTNDLQAGFGPEHPAENIRAILKALGDAGIGVVLHSLPFAQGGFGRTFNERVARLNETLRPIARESGARFLDLNALTARDGVLDPDLTYDGLHLDAAGYIVWSGALRPILAEMLGAQKPD